MDRAITMTLYYEGSPAPVPTRQAMLEHILPSLEAHPLFTVLTASSDKIEARHREGHMIVFETAPILGPRF